MAFSIERQIFKVVYQAVHSYTPLFEYVTKSLCGFRGCRRAFCWNSMWRNLQRHEVIGSSGEVNWLIDGPCGERLPAIDLAHVDLTGGEQRPEQHGGSLC